MKTIIFTALFILAASMFTVSCSKKNANGGQEAENASLLTGEALSVDALLENPESLTDSLIVVEGVCTHTCRHGATKMFLIGTDDSKTIRVEACDLGSFKPEVINSFVTVEGYLREQRIDPEYLQAWEQKVKENQTEEHGETGAGCESERAARGVESVSALDQINEYRQRIEDKVSEGGNPWISFYYIDAVDYKIKE